MFEAIKQIFRKAGNFVHNFAQKRATTIRANADIPSTLENRLNILCDKGGTLQYT